MMEMKKILVFGMIFLFISIAFAPSINLNIVKASRNKESIAKLRTISLDDLNDVKTVDKIKHPLLYLLVISLFTIRNIRSAINFFITFIVLCAHPNGDLFLGTIMYPILFIIFLIKTAWLVVTTEWWLSFWAHLSDSQGWNWNLNPFFSANYQE